jgi:hypothetical protein
VTAEQPRKCGVGRAKVWIKPAMLIQPGGRRKERGGEKKRRREEAPSSYKLGQKSR